MTDKQIELITKAIDIVVKWNNALLQENVELLKKVSKLDKHFKVPSWDSYDDKIAEEDANRAKEKPWLRENL